MVIAVTSEALQATASATDYGAYGAVQRVSLTAMGEGGNAGIQVTYTNPVYMAHAHRMGGDLAAVRAVLEGALGTKADYGSEEGLTKDELGEYRYMGFPMYTELFDQHFDLVMIGDHGFTSIMCAPDAIREALEEAAGVIPPPPTVLRGPPKND